MNTCKVSILIPLYNSEKYIAETINSALSQTWKNIEIIIVDDGSTDNSYSITQSFESKIVKVYQQEHKGASAARNLAFEKSTGVYIQYLDADDLLSPDKIEKQMEYFKQFDDEICTSCKSVRFKVDKSIHTDIGKRVSKDYINPLDYMIDTWETGCYLGIHAWLFPRKIVEKVGDWDNGLTRFQDADFLTRVLSKINKIKYVPDCVAYYRDSPSSLTKQAYDEIEKARSILINKIVNNIVIPSGYLRAKQASIVYLSKYIYRWYPGYPQMADSGFESLSNLESSILLKSNNIIVRLLTFFFGWKNSRNFELFFNKIRNRLLRLVKTWLLFF